MHAVASLLVAVTRDDWEAIDRLEMITREACMEPDAAGKYPVDLAIERGAPLKLVLRMREAKGLTVAAVREDWEIIEKLPQIITREACAAQDRNGKFPLELAQAAGSAPAELVARPRELSPPAAQMSEAIMREDWEATDGLATSQACQQRDGGYCPAGAAAEAAAPKSLFLSHRGFDDADFTALTEALTSGSAPSTVESLDLSDNDLATLPLALLELRSLSEINLSGNPRLQTVARIAEEKGVPGVFAYLQDLYDDPQEEFKLKVMLAGASMAGKSSLLRGLIDQVKTLTTKDERTIGLEIERLVLRGLQGRAPAGLIFLVYDAGGHDEYQLRCCLTFSASLARRLHSVGSGLTRLFRRRCTHPACRRTPCTSSSGTCRSLRLSAGRRRSCRDR